MSWGRLSFESGYQMRPSLCNRCIVSFEYRHPSAGGWCPRHTYVIETKATFRIEINYVVDVIVFVAVTPCRRALPNNFVLTCVLAEHVIKYHFRVVSDMPVKMDVDRAVFSKKFPQQHDRVIEPLQIRIESAAPCISVCLLLQNRRLL